MRISDWSSDGCSSDLRGYRPKAVDETIRQAIATFHPELVKKPETGKDDWDVRVDHDAGYAQGTSRLDAIGDSLDLEKFHQLINDEATTLGRLGDRKSTRLNSSH